MSPAGCLSFIVGQDMIFGHQSRFAIEAYSERLPTSPAGVWGRSCIHVCGHVIGDIHEPHCQLDQFADAIVQAISQLDHDPEWRFAVLDDSEVFEFLDQRLYRDDGQSIDEMSDDWKHFGRFCFLTNVGEQFDGWKTFMFTRSDDSVRLLSRDRVGKVASYSVEKSDLRSASSGFLEWMEKERKAAQPGATDNPDDAQRLREDH